MKLQPTEKIITDNLMTRDQILSYLKDDFCVDLEKIKEIILLDQISPELNLLVKKIPHHRYNIFFAENSGKLYLQATEGKLRTKHLEFESKIMSSLVGHSIKFTNTTAAYENLVSAWTIRMKQALSDRKIDGVLIGSMWNFNFYIKFLTNNKFADKFTEQVDQLILKKYVDHQLALYVIEDEYINGRLRLTEHEKNIFQEGHLPDPKAIKITQELTKRIPTFDDKVQILYSKSDLISYIKTDYLFFFDLNNGTSLFKETLVSDVAEIIDDYFLSYQLITIKGATYINFSWANADVLNAVLKELGRTFNLKSFYMYGKCGSLTANPKIGDLVVPVRSYNNETFIDIHNEVEQLHYGVKKVNFMYVDSPLVETKTWANESLKLGCDCVDMELDPSVRALSKNTVKKIIYYISDQPMLGLTLSDRISLLKQRLDCSKIIIEDILKREG